MVRQYMTSGRVNRWRAAAVLPVSFAAAVGLGVAYQWALNASGGAIRFPVITILLIGVAAAVAVVAVADFTGRFIHSRHTGFGTLTGLALAAIFVFAGHWWDFASSPTGRLSGVSLWQHLAQERAAGIPLVKNKSGATVAGLSGWLALLAWLFEAGLLAVAGLLGGAAGSSRPYCESCRSWISRAKWKFTLKNVDEGAAALLKGEKTLEPLLSVRPARLATEHSLVCRVRACRCAGSADLRVKGVRTKRNENGSTSESEDVLMEELLLDPRGMDRLMSWAEAIDPSMAEKRPKLAVRAAEPFTLKVEECLAPSGEHVSLYREYTQMGASDSHVDNAYTKRLREQLRTGDYQAAMAAIKAQRHVEDLAFVAEACADWDGEQPWLAAWERDKPDSAAMALVRGIHFIKWGWQARGVGFTPKNLDVFWDRLRTGEQYLFRAAELAPRDPTAWAWLIYAAKGLQHDKEEAFRRLEQVRARAPHHRFAHSVMVQFLAPKWYGSTEEMLDFARRAAASAPAGSHLSVALAEAHLEAAYTLERNKNTTAAEYFADPAVAADIRRANDRCFRSGSYKPTMDTPRTRHYFAFALWKAGEREAAAEHLRSAGISGWWGVFSNLPWSRDSLRRARRECGVK